MAQRGSSAGGGRNRRAGLVSRRRALGYTQERIAHELAVDVSTVARWERGRTGPLASMRPELARLLEVPLAELAELIDGLTVLEPVPPAADGLLDTAWTSQRIGGFRDGVRADAAPAVTAAEAPRLAHRWLVTDPPGSVARRGGRRIGREAVESVAVRAERLRHADDVLAGGELHLTVRRELADAATLLGEASYAEQHGRRLLAAIAELCHLAGWSTADAGFGPHAENYYLHGIGAAHAADDPVLAGHLVSSLAYRVANFGDARDAALLARSALAGAKGRLSSTTRALFLARLAWACARNGERDQAERALGEARESYERRHDGECDPEWVYCMSPDEMDVVVGHTQVELGAARRATPLLENAIGGCDRRRARELSLYTTWLAEAHVQTGELDRAAQLAQDACRLNEATASSYSNGRVRDLLRRIRWYGLEVDDSTVY